MIVCEAGLAQGLNYELGFNSSFDQEPTSVICFEEYSWILYERVDPSGWGGYPELVMVDTLGTVELEIPVLPLIDFQGSIGYPESTWVLSMISNGEGGVIISGKMMAYCDYGLMEGFVHEYDFNGQLTWSLVFDQPDMGQTYLTGLYLDDGGFARFNRSFSQNWPIDSVISQVLTVSSSGTIIDSMMVDPIDLEGFVHLNGYEIVGFKQDTIFGFDASGNTVDFQVVSSDVKGVHSFGMDSIIVLTVDSILLLTGNLNQVTSASFAGYNHYSNLRVSGDNIQIISSDPSEQHVLTIDFQLQLVDVVTIPLTLNSGDRMDFHGAHFTVAVEFDLSSFRSVRLMDYSLSNPVNDFINEYDVSVSSVQIYQTDPFLHPPTDNVYSFNYDVGAMVQNFGAEAVHSVRINCRRGWTPACNASVFTQNFTGLNILPGDSLLIDLGWIGLSTGTIYDPNLGNQFCVYSSHPNGQTDLHVSNDSHCELGYSGPVGVKEISSSFRAKVFPNPSNGRFTIQLPAETETVSAQILDVHGRVLYLDSVNGLSTFEIDLTDQPVGLYFLKLESERHLDFSKLIKE